MSFNKGYELKKFEAHWEKLRIEYAAAGMTEEAIQKMYDYDRLQFNSERTFIERTQEFTAPAYESSEEEASPLMLRYQDAITVTDTYHETKSRFAWIGEIENERLLSALENLSEDDLKLLTFYAYEGYTVTEISKVLGVSQPTISIKIKRITNFLKKFDFDAMD
ncbi:MAG: sigma-70 family RNA polymerase sigma factor [Faecalibacterium sp.]